jgi:hypothetical protein
MDILQHIINKEPNNFDFLVLGLLNLVFLVYGVSFVLNFLDKRKGSGASDKKDEPQALKKAGFPYELIPPPQKSFDGSNTKIESVIYPVEQRRDSTGKKSEAA